MVDDQVTQVSVSGIDQRSGKRPEGHIGSAEHRGSLEHTLAGAEVVGRDVPEVAGNRVHARDCQVVCQSPNSESPVIP